MSSEISPNTAITPSEIATVINGIPPFAAPKVENSWEAALSAMTRRSPKATTTRVIFYRFDQGRDPAADEIQAQLQGGEMPFHEVAREVDCDVQLIEIGEGDIDENDNARACAFGMMAAEEDTGLLVIAAFGAGSDARAKNTDPDHFFETATPETAAMYGAMVAAARANIPVIAEGPHALAAVKALRPDLRAHVFICGVHELSPHLNIFADRKECEKGYSAIMLAATLQSEHAKRQKAA